VEARDTELAISFWKEKAQQLGNPPPIAEFSIADPVAHSFRFLIGTTLHAHGDRVFLAYGPGLATLLGLPQQNPPVRVPLIECLPHRYRFLFLRGCGEAVAEAAPVRFEGEEATLGGAELYRACFMPLKMTTDKMLGVYGSFNFRFRTAADLGERSRSVDAADGPMFTERYSGGLGSLLTSASSNDKG
jgi:hypothetical protein